MTGLQNSGFETWSGGYGPFFPPTNGQQLADFWFYSGSANLYVLGNTGFARSGSVGMQLTWFSGGGAAKVYQDITNYTDFMGKITVFSIWVNSSNQDMSGFKLRIDDGVSTTDTNFPASSNTWVQVTVQQTVSMSATKLEFTIVIPTAGGSQSFVADDASVSIQSPPVIHLPTQLVAARISSDAIAAFSFSAGTVCAFGGPVAPTGYLACDGLSYATSLYPNLFAAIGYTYGGSGANFNVPDCRGRVPFGAGSGTGLTPRPLGTSGGTDTHSHTVNSHTHTYSNQSHSHTGTHSHIIQAGGGHDHVHGGTGGNFVAGGWFTEQEGQHSHTGFTNTASTVTGVTNAALGNSAPTSNAISHTNPYVAVNFIIKT